MNDLSQQFQYRFVATAYNRLRRALAALSSNPSIVYQELHGLAGEAGIMGYSDISMTAATGLQLATAWRTRTPTGDQELQCARILRSLINLVNELERAAAPAQRAAIVATSSALILDNSELIAEELAEVLRRAGIEAAIACTLDGAVLAARARRLDVVLVDANLPVGDLRVLCDSIRKHAKAAKLMIMSASTEDELQRFATEVGADGYAEKLRGTASILERVQALLAKGAT